MKQARDKGRLVSLSAASFGELAIFPSLLQEAQDARAARGSLLLDKVGDGNQTHNWAFFVYVSANTPRTKHSESNDSSMSAPPCVSSARAQSRRRLRTPCHCLSAWSPRVARQVSSTLSRGVTSAGALAPASQGCQGAARRDLTAKRDRILRTLPTAPQQLWLRVAAGAGRYTTDCAIPSRAARPVGIPVWDDGPCPSNVYAN